jgi:DNA-binding transcriptional MocR family regulator
MLHSIRSIVLPYPPDGHGEASDSLVQFFKTVMANGAVRMNDQIPASTTRVAAVMAAIRQRIAGRSLTPGAKLPSVRALAATMKLSTSTVVEAYERLVAEGAILSRPGSGFYVANQAAPFALSEVGPRLDREIDPFWVSRQSLEAGDIGLKPGCGWLPPA